MRVREKEKEIAMTSIDDSYIYDFEYSIPSV